MIKKLILIRHGKAEPIGPGQSDFDRGLTGPGRAALSSVGGFMRSF